MRGFFLLLALSPSATFAQVSYPPSITANDVTNAINAATPAPCTAPLSDTYGGSAGSSPVCMSRPDATRPTQVKSVSITTASDGTFAGNWVDSSGNPSPFPSVPTSAWANVFGQTQPFLCMVQTKTSTGFTGRCFALTTMTLPSTATALLGLVLSPYQNAAGGLTALVSARQ